MKMTQGEQARLNGALRKRLLEAPSEARRFLPAIFSQPVVSFSHMTDRYFLTVVVAEDERARIEDAIHRGRYPFPGLITHDASAPVAFRLNNSKNTFIANCAVDNMYSIGLGRDCTVVLANHTQSIDTVEYGQTKYVLPWAYIISFGEEITLDNLHNYLDDLIAYSTTQWRYHRGG